MLAHFCRASLDFFGVDAEGFKQPQNNQLGSQNPEELKTWMDLNDCMHQEVEVCRLGACIVCTLVSAILVERMVSCMKFMSQHATITANCVSTGRLQGGLRISGQLGEETRVPCHGPSAENGVEDDS